MKTAKFIVKVPVSALAGALFLLSINSHALRVESEENLKNYHDSISAQNLINGLNLTGEQQKKILELNYNLKKLRDSEMNDPKAQKLKNELELAMKDLNEFLAKNPEQENKVLQDKASAANHARKEYQTQRAKKLKTELDSYSEELNKTLSKEQLQVISTFKPCLIPPKDIRDPVRAGQAQQGAMGDKMLSRLREIKDPARAKEAINKAADRIVTMTDEKVYQMNDAQKAAKKEELVKVLTEAQKMNDTDFELKKNEILSVIRPEKGSKTINRVVSDFSENKTSKYLLDPDVIIPILEKRMQSGTAGGLR